MAWTVAADRSAAEEAALAQGALMARLRAATAPAHARLEARLDLLRAPVSREHIVAVVEGFHGFHAAWEPAMDGQAPLAALWQGRSRLTAIRADLVRLGRTPAQVGALPCCLAAATLATTPWRALGSLYVLEGSTLGGQLIGRALAAAPWAPPEGLATFHPYGAQTGERWRAFRAGTEALVPAEAVALVVDGALAAFAVLEAWLPRRRA